MKSYFKYTNGEAFTIDGQDYVGFLHFTDGNAYTGKVDSLDMDILEPKNTFMANFYQNGGNFNTTFRHVESNKPFFSNVNDLINLQGLLTMIQHLNANNLICFKNLVLYHPTVYQFEKNDNFYYALSSGTETTLVGRQGTTHAVPFANSPTWEYLDRVTSGSFIVSPDEAFTYFTSTGIELFALAGSFGSPQIPITEIDRQNFHTFPPTGGITDFIYNIYHDEDANRLFIVFNDTIRIYDTSSFENCQSLDSLLLVDILPLGGEPSTTTDFVWGTTEIKFGEANFAYSTPFSINNPNNPESVSIGNNLRTSFDPKEGILHLYNKFSDDLITNIDLRAYNISALYSIDIRNTDDNVLMMYRHNDTSLRVLYIDPETIEIEDSMIFSLSAADRFTIKFSGIDSDVFYTSTPFEYQTRFLSAPEWPAGRLETGDLHYPFNFKWGQPLIAWGSFPFPFGYGASGANSYFNLISPEIIKNNKMYLMLHNIGRLYTMNQPPPDRFLNAVPLDVESNYEEPTCSESTLGLYFNSAISIIVRDILILFSKAFGSFNIAERAVTIQKLQDLITTNNNLYLNGNETFNVLAIQRILVLINDLQTALLSKSIEK